MAKKTDSTQAPEDTGKLHEKKGRHADGRFKKGVSGNKKGRPPGSRNQSTLAAQQILNADSKNITRKAVELALSGDRVALKLCLERLIPPRKDNPISIALPDASTPDGLRAAHAAVLQLMSEGQITPLEATSFSNVLKEFRLSIESSEFDERLKALEARLDKK